MSRKHEDPRGKQKGAQSHPEGAHGEKTHQRLVEELRSRASGEEGEQKEGGAPPR